MYFRVVFALSFVDKMILKIEHKQKNEILFFEDVLQSTSRQSASDDFFESERELRRESVDRKRLCAILSDVRF